MGLDFEVTPRRLRLSRREQCIFDNRDCKDGRIIDGRRMEIDIMETRCQDRDRESLLRAHWPVQYYDTRHQRYSSVCLSESCQHGYTTRLRPGSVQTGFRLLVLERNLTPIDSRARGPNLSAMDHMRVAAHTNSTIFDTENGCPVSSVVEDNA